MGRGAFNKSGLLSPSLSSCGEERENISSGQAVVVSRCARGSAVTKPVLDEERFGGVTTTKEIAYAPNERLTETDLAADRSSDQPLVYHLLGLMSPSIDYVITEEDTLEFFYALHEKDKRPVRLFDELRSHHLLIIGCSFPDWLARFFIRIARDGPLSARRESSEFLADHRIQQTEQNLVLFLQHFSHRTEIFPGGAVEFVEELTSRIPSIRPASDSLPVPKGTIFLSYASEDRKAAENIRAGLEKAKLNVWFDMSRLQGGEEFERKIEQAIHEAALFVPIISSHTEGDSASFFRREWAYALDRVKDFTGSSLTFLLPVTIDETGLETAREVPREFKKCHWVNLPGGQATPEFPELVKGKVREYVKGQQGRQ